MDTNAPGTTPLEAGTDEEDAIPMPDLPARLNIETEQQYKAIADRIRQRILGIIQQRPATAKQIAVRLGIAPGTAGHHLQVLEAAGLAQVVATRLVHGIVAKYYTRTARIFMFKEPAEMQGGVEPKVDILGDAHDELLESLAAYPEPLAEYTFGESFPHVRLSDERARYYRDRLDKLVEEIVSEPQHLGGTVYGIALAMFKSPPYLQDVPASRMSGKLPSWEPDEGER